MRRGSGRHRFTSPTALPSRVSRLRLAAVLAAVAVVLGVVAVPVGSTLAMFTDAESVVSSKPIVAGSLGTVTSLTCSTPGILFKPLVLGWKSPDQATIQPTGYRLSFTEAGSNAAIVVDVGADLSEQIDVSDSRFVNGKTYLVTVKARADSAPNWLSGSTTSITATKSFLFGWNSCK